jgi:hypothetical protein
VTRRPWPLAGAPGRVAEGRVLLRRLSLAQAGGEWVDDSDSRTAAGADSDARASAAAEPPRVELGESRRRADSGSDLRPAAAPRASGPR